MKAGRNISCFIYIQKWGWNGNSTSLKDCLPRCAAAAGVCCCFHREVSLLRTHYDRVTFTWASPSRRGGGTGHFHANQCFGDPAAAWWAVTTRGGRRRGGEGTLETLSRWRLWRAAVLLLDIHPYSVQSLTEQRSLQLVWLFQCSSLIPPKLSLWLVLWSIDLLIVFSV